MARPPYRRKASAFVAHLYEMMTNPKLAPYCGFVPDGKSFYVTHSKEFLDTVLPQYYKHNRMRSFLRQLNQYSFAKQPIDITSMSFSHPRFLRGRKDLLKQVQRRAPGEPAVTAESFGDEVYLKNDEEGATCNHQFEAQSLARAPPEAMANSEPNGAFSRAPLGHAKRRNESSMGEDFAEGPGQDQIASIARSQDRIIQATANVRASSASLMNVAEENFEVEDSEEQGEEENDFVSDSCSSELANQEGNFTISGGATAAKTLIRIEDATAGIASGSSAWTVGSGHQSAVSDDLKMTEHPASLDGEVRSDGVSPLSDYSDLFLGSSVDFALPFPELSEGGGGAFDLDDTLLPDLEAVREYSDGGGAKIQPCMLCQPTGDNTSSPQRQTTAKVNYQQIPLTQKSGFVSSAMLAPLPPSQLPPIAETESSFERQRTGSSSGNGASPVTVAETSPLVLGNSFLNEPVLMH